MMRRILGALLLLTLLASCGTKKRSIQKRKTYPATTEKAVAKASKKDKFESFIITSVPEYITTFSGIAQDEMRAYGIPASITIAQGILESGGGKGALTAKTNNHFGIKCHKGWEGKYELHDDDEKGECFRKYNHPRQSFTDHSLFLSGRSRYAFLFDLDKDDYEGWAKGLRKAGYATDKKYPQKLIALIERYELYNYDDEVLKNSKRKRRRDAIKIHTVEAGDTLYSLSRKYNSTVDDLMKINKLSSPDLAIGQELKIIKK